MNLIEIIKLKKEYQKKTVFENLDLIIPYKGIILLKGENGIGKSTLFKILSKMVKYEAGIIKYHDPDFFKKSSFLLDIPIFLESLNFKDNMSLVGSLLNLSSGEVSEKVNYFQKKFDLPNETLYGDYSLGMKKKAEIARTLIDKPDYLFWDEPFNSLDEKTIEFVVKEILDTEKLFCIITHEHYLDERATQILDF